MTRLMRWSSAIVLAGLIALGACSRHGSTGEADALGQVVARVNGEEITISQVNAELATISAGDQDPKLVKQEVLRAIVFRTLLRQAALKDKLDQKPQVRLLMDAARDKVLADSYMTSITGSDKPPTAADVTKFIADHPLAFGERRIYQFQRLTLASDQYSDTLVPMFDQKQTFDEFENYLNGKHIPFTLAEVRLPSTDFPKQVQDQLVRFRVGDNVVVRGPQSIIILKIKGWTEMPVQEADAQRVASTALRQEADSERTSALRTQLIHDSKIEFTGDFAGMNPDEPKAPPPITAETAPPPDTAAPPNAAAPAIPLPSTTNDSQLQTSSPSPSPPANSAPSATGGSSTNPQEGGAQ